MSIYKPMSEPKQLTYYDYYSDIEPNLCEYMGIKQEHFRNYQPVNGHDGKDFWHVLLGILGGHFNGNDTYFTMYSQKEDDQDESTFDYLDEYYTKLKMQGNHYSHVDEWQDHRSWSRPLYDAVDKLHEEYGDEITVWISW